MRMRITIEVETSMKRDQFNAEVSAIAYRSWPVLVYLATEKAEDSKRNVMVDDDALTN